VNGLLFFVLVTGVVRKFEYEGYALDENLTPVVQLDQRAPVNVSVVMEHTIPTIDKHLPVGFLQVVLDTDVFA
jgi:hypothetical protein